MKVKQDNLNNLVQINKLKAEELDHFRSELIQKAVE